MTFQVNKFDPLLTHPRDRFHPGDSPQVQPPYYLLSSHNIRTQTKDKDCLINCCRTSYQSEKKGENRGEWDKLGAFYSLITGKIYSWSIHA